MPNPAHKTCISVMAITTKSTNQLIEMTTGVKKSKNSLILPIRVGKTTKIGVCSATSTKLLHYFR